MDEFLAPLFTPWCIGELTLANRFVMAPMTRWHSPSGIPGRDVAEYYERRARGGVGLIITEANLIPHATAGNETNIPRMYGSASLEGWRAVVARVHAAETPIFAQVWHQGFWRGDAPELNPDVSTVSPSGLGNDEERIGRPITLKEIDEVIVGFANAAMGAKKSGFDGVEIHGAHGYIVDEFMWPSTNLRTDRYGGNLANRSRFPAEVVSAIRSAVGPNFPISFRFSQWKVNAWTARNADSPRELEKLLEPIVAAGANVIHASTRRYSTPAFVELSGADATRTLSGWIRQITGLPTIAVGSIGLSLEFDAPTGTNRIEKLTNIPNLIMNKQCDAIALGRSLIADPEWVNKVREGRDEELTTFSPDVLQRLF